MALWKGTIYERLRWSWTDGGRVNLETLRGSRWERGPRLSADPTSLRADPPDHLWPEKPQASAPLRTRPLQTGGSGSSEVPGHLRERSKHGPGKGGAPHCGAQERLLCSEARNAAGIFPLCGKVLLLSQMRIYRPAGRGAGAAALRLHRCLCGRLLYTGPSRKLRKGPTLHAHAHTQAWTHTPHTSHVSQTHSTYSSHTQTHCTPHTHSPRPALGKQSVQAEAPQGSQTPAPACSLQALAGEAQHRLSREGVLHGRTSRFPVSVSPRLCSGEPPSRSSRRGHPRGYQKESPEMWGKQGWGGGAKSEHSSWPAALSPGLMRKQNILKSKYHRRLKRCIDDVSG